MIPTSKMMRLMKSGMIAIVSLAAMALQTQASVTFDFSFTNTEGNVSGTVTGQIFGLMDNSTGPATDVVIDSYPANMGDSIGIVSVNPNTWSYINSNTFTVANGVLTGAAYYALDVVPDGAVSFILTNLGGPSFGLLRDSDGYGPTNHMYSVNSSSILITPGAGGQAYLLPSTPPPPPPTASTPEPSSITVWFAMTFVAAGWFHVVQRRRKASGLSPACRQRFCKSHFVRSFARRWRSGVAVVSKDTA